MTMTDDDVRCDINGIFNFISLTDLFITTSQCDGSLPCLKSSPVSPPIELEFTPHDLLLIKRFRSDLGRVGVKFVIGCNSESIEPRNIIVHELPCVFVEREVSETRRRRPSVAVVIVKVGDRVGVLRGG